MFETIDEVSIYYELTETNHDQTLVFIHAGICDSSMWLDQVTYFSQFYNILVFDLRGFGKSSFSDKEFIHAKDLKVLVEKLPIQQFHLIGCSFGCQVAVDFVLEFPEIVNSLTLVNGGPMGFATFGNDPPPLSLKAEEAFNDKNIPLLAEIEAMIWLVGRKRSRGDIESKLFQKVVEMDIIALKNESSVLPKEKKFHSHPMDELNYISKPTLIMIGELDEPSFVTGCRNVARMVRAKEEIIPETAHLPNMEKPETFNKILDSFLKGL